MSRGAHITRSEAGALPDPSRANRDTSPAGAEADTDRHIVSMQEGGVEGEGLVGATREHGGGEPSQPPLPSGRVENKPDGPAVTAADTISDAQQRKDNPAPASDGSEEYPGLAVTNSQRA